MNDPKTRTGIERIARIAGLVAIDLALVFFSLVLATMVAVEAKGASFRFPFYDNGQVTFSYLQILLTLGIYILCFSLFRMYSDIWTKSGVGENFYILAALAIGTGLCLVINIPFGNENKFNFCFAGMILLPLLFLERYAARIVRRLKRELASRNRENKRPILIAGAGFFGTYVLAQIASGVGEKDGYVVAFVDDDPAKQGTRVHGVPVRGTTADIPWLVNQLGVREIIIAIPSINDRKQADLAALCKSTRCRVRMVSPLRDLDAPPTMRDIREIKVDDILFRPEVLLDKEGIAAYIQHKTVLVTGGGGSIGSEICRQVASFYPERLVIFDIYENNAYELLCEFSRKHPWLNATVRIGSVRERKRVDQIMEEFKPDLVLHCAAHKHVPLMEESPGEAVKNNVLGTMNVLYSAGEHGVKRFVQLSTDKAVNPTNVMGASKRVTELVVQEYAKSSKMKCMTVRFGNVLGSYGSVIPLFERQIMDGGPVLVTDPNITRYFMSIPEAAQLVLQVGALGETGAVYVLDMGEPVKILDLAEKLIRYHGYTPYTDIPIEFVGLRAGEKMYEELVMDDEDQAMEPTSHNRIMRAQPTQSIAPHFQQKLEALLAAASACEGDILPLLSDVLPNFRHAHNGNAEKE